VTGGEPSLERLARRLAECPASFLAAPRLGAADGVHVDAVVHDVLAVLGGGPFDPGRLRPFAPPEARSARHLALVLIACWLLGDDWFRGSGVTAAAALRWLCDLATLSEAVAPELFVRDPDRREELTRRCLAALGLRPAGETVEQSEDRLRTLDSLERLKLLRDTREQQERARKLREEMMKQAAIEAAAKASREW
jgi:hypothetical protein